MARGMKNGYTMCDVSVKDQSRYVLWGTDMKKVAKTVFGDVAFGDKFRRVR